MRGILAARDANGADDERRGGVKRTERLRLRATKSSPPRSTLVVFTTTTFAQSAPSRRKVKVIEMLFKRTIRNFFLVLNHYHTYINIDTVDITRRRMVVDGGR